MTMSLAYGKIQAVGGMVALLLWLGLSPAPVFAGTAAGEAANPDLHVVLSREFFEAMSKLSQDGTAYGDRQEVWLQKIAVAGQFAVKTNLTLIQQQERIIRLLEELARQRLAPPSSR
jgi:hypothetical protein